MEKLTKLLRDSYDLQEQEPEKSTYWHLQQLRSEIKQLTLTSVVDSSNKGVEAIHKLSVKYHHIGLELEKRKEAVTDLQDINVIDLQIKTNETIVEDLILTAGSLL